MSKLLLLTLACLLACFDEMSEGLLLSFLFFSFFFGGRGRGRGGGEGEGNKMFVGKNDAFCGRVYFFFRDVPH